MSCLHLVFKIAPLMLMIIRLMNNKAKINHKPFKISNKWRKVQQSAKTSMKQKRMQAIQNKILVQHMFSIGGQPLLHLNVEEERKPKD